MTNNVGTRSPSRARIGRRGAVAAAALGLLAGPAFAVSSAAAASGSGAKISAVQTSNFGKVLADGDTVYTLKPSSTACTAQCLKVWPAVTVPAGAQPKAGSGVNAAKLGTVTVKGVGLQVTYGGKKLYRFVEDTAPGQVNGAVTDKWGKWSPVVLSKSGSSGSGSKGGGSTAGSGGASF